MKLQHKVILSLGSNLGDRLLNLQNAVNLLHEKVATVVKISNVYQSEAWGFVSDDFLNCVILLHSQKDSKQFLHEILALEKDLGRIRTADKNYQARAIDIDIIAFDDEIITEEDLHLPHIEMQNRKFVLLPLQEIMPEFEHPILKKNVPELIHICPDKTRCEYFSTLNHPLKVNLNNISYLAIEGNIGAGKTTLTHKIAEDFKAKPVLEGFADNPFLPKFYKDQARYAFPLEMSFLADRYQQLSHDLSQYDLFSDFIVADYHIFKSLIFSKVTLGDDEYRLYKTLFDIIYKEMRKPDLYVYLYQNTERLLENIKKRGRSYEQEIPADYLEKINQGYLDYIKTQTSLNVLVIDVSKKDFVSNQQDYLDILEEIQRKISN
ncbi:2-amino-4-hydroxy-6-hydroxymethyldihydropteridine diphosphokinase [Flavobacterium sp. NST-5]|uniref:2-amino-4-hydroxy-6-hydroxymethyldihydropteridine pyrophosphokinase n=1 Tax=Flavobacterium ichthyis TaxID=2698827 RepID=A0ABW9ZA46_9FLAO|nr:2-amino-4-hydroxy-6-hydroxymethyldihydropteridine diphosphokinase [Flavobacterium ichthyis]NBL63673.1 2-amino-4-hydroxy-6-hydroxymethyldihydropteridine diphosphokinase [Flavobacterium ichthyis]